MKMILAALSLMALFGCTKRNSGIEVSWPDGSKVVLPLNDTLRINLSTEPPSLDWHKSTDSTSNQIEMNIMDGVLEYDISGSQPKLGPGLALKWEALEKGRIWKFTFRDGIVWSDGVPFKVQHVVDGWKRVLTRATASEYGYFLYDIKNARPYNEGKVTDFSQVGIKITGPNELTVELEKPLGYFPYMLTHHSTYPARIDLIEKHGDKWTEPPNLVTLGPYILRSWQHDKMVVLERNEKYHGEKPGIKYIVGYMIIEQATAINLFDSGKLDSVHSLPSAELRKLKTRKEFKQTSSLVTYYYGFNIEKPPVNDPRVRKALSMAIDRKQIVDMLGGGQIPLSSWVPPGMAGYEPTVGVNFDPEKAKALLKEAGFSDPAKMPKIELKFNTNEDHQRIAENVQSQLKKNLGVDIELRNEEWKVYLKTLKTDPPAIWRMGWVGDFPDPANFLGVLLSYSDNNRTRWKNKKYDELVEKGSGMLDGPERKETFIQAQKILTEQDLPVIPFYSSVYHYLVSDRVEAYPINPLLRYRYTLTRLKAQN